MPKGRDSGTSGSAQQSDRPRPPPPRSALRLLAYLRPHWLAASVVLLANFAMTGLGLVTPQLIRLLLDDVILSKGTSPDAKYRLLTLVSLAGLGVFVGIALFRLLNSLLSHRVGQKIILKLREDLFSRLQGLSLRFFESRPTGEIMSRVVNDTDAVEDLIVHTIENFLSSAITLAGVAVILFVSNARLAAFTLMPVPLLVAVVVVFAVRFKHVFKNVRERLADLNTFLQERISGIRVVKSFAAEDQEQQSFHGAAKRYYDAFLKAVLTFSTFGPLMGLLTSLGSLIVIFFGGRLALAGNLKVGELVAFYAYLAFFYSPIGQLGYLFGNALPRSLAAADRIFEFMDEQDRPTVPAEALRPERLVGRIEFRGVYFKYDHEDVLKDINLTIEPGEAVALVGPSGVGKTTLVDLISRMYDPQQGQVLIDGMDVRQYDLKALRSQIGVVLQEPFLFNTTIRENIAYGNLQAPDEQVRHAAQVAGADEFISALEKGYDAAVGERGVKLSVGEKQRISIARALLKDPPILVLDEATSSVDTPTEHAIQQALERAARGRTTIIVAHRLSTTRIADRIVVLEEGAIVEQGSREELIEKGGLFARLWQMQNLEADAATGRS